MLNWNNTTLDIVRAFKNFHATRLPAFKIASGGRQVGINMTEFIHPSLRRHCTERSALIPVS